ncbi:hypothetical protein [Limnoglobus roseus]|uniref:YHS domain-containing protein n=1 Tax=Limnoglobus roseus TaxID=2598579 RepID=A0A5C1A997_9BACT|nr:hypothetical protein [Limnoglobus roseus]QEL15105.1 hypothetical protein PX52LOC_02014 [Limnoglobus roseus]
MAVDRGGVVTAVGVLTIVGAVGVLAYQAQKGRPVPRPHNHAHAAADRGPSVHSRIVSLGNDEYHAEVVLATDGKLHLFVLGADEGRVQAVAGEPLPALLKGSGDPAAVEVMLAPSPQPGDPPGTTSRFVTAVPGAVVARPLEVTVPNLSVEGKRFRFTASVGAADHAAEMPAKVADDEERRLYLTSGGDYTAADIVANGRRTASEKFKGFRAKHDAHPSAGDLLCPITGTKAHQDCSWVVGGKTYTFCCPPCVDEFVKQAKDRPGTIRVPEEYVQK